MVGQDDIAFWIMIGVLPGDDNGKKSAKKTSASTPSKKPEPQKEEPKPPTSPDYNECKENLSLHKARANQKCRGLYSLWNRKECVKASADIAEMREQCERLLKQPGSGSS